MKQFGDEIRSPVRREGASRNLLLMLLAFAFSVAFTRLFLQLTGNPQLGNESLHIAHVLWGGLLLFLASLLPLVIANRWVYTLCSILAGAGVGLFIDEVGKFITRTNDYFYPPAAPIIYVVFLVTVLIYVQIRKPPSRDPRAAFYRVLESLQEVLDRDLEAGERAELVARLYTIGRNSDDPNLRRLAGELLHFLENEPLALAPTRAGLWKRMQTALEQWESQRLTHTRLRIALAGGLAALGGLQIAGLLRVLFALSAPEKLKLMMSGWILNSHVSSVAALDWFSARLALEASVGAMLVFAAGLLIIRREKLGVSLGVVGLLLSLAAVNLLVFYFDQFSTILPAGVQFILLLGLLHYQSKHLVRVRHPRKPQPSIPEEASADSFSE